MLSVQRVITQYVPKMRGATYGIKSQSEFKAKKRGRGHKSSRKENGLGTVWPIRLQGQEGKGELDEEEDEFNRHSCVSFEFWL